MGEMIKDIQPRELFKYFDEILRIPRPSKQEERIVQYLMDFGEKHGLDTQRDEIGNVLIRKPATPGHEHKKSVVLQSHVDMVCEKNSDVSHDFSKDPIRAYVDSGWVRSRGTTLGADDGIGVAAQLALLAADDIPHGPIECLFTVDEETGLTGAYELKEGFLQSDILLNLDSEDWGEFFIGCAGGVDTLGHLPVNLIRVPGNTRTIELTVRGLVGGHSGDDIHKGRANAVKVIARILYQLDKEFTIHLATLEAGNLRNAIAREGRAVFCLSRERCDEFKQRIDEIATEFAGEFHVTEPQLRIEWRWLDPALSALDRDSQTRLLELLLAIPHGVQAMSQDIEGLVETSTNLAAVKKLEGSDVFLITTSQRSSNDFSKWGIAWSVESAMRLAGCEVKHSDGYPGWTPNTQSSILVTAVAAYRKLFDEEPIVRAIHAGLECGLFLQKYPGMDMISFGPTIRGAHSPDERLDIDSTVKFWALLLEILINVPEIHR